MWLVSFPGSSTEPAMNGTSGFQQDAQKGRPARPQKAKRRCVLCSVRGASERSENAAGGLFQHPARSCGLLPPHHHRLASCTSNSLNSEQVPGTFSVLTISSLSPQASARSGKRFLASLGHTAGLDIVTVADIWSVKRGADERRSSRCLPGISHEWL